MSLLRATDLASLAPDRLVSYRQQRYIGDAMDVPLDAFDVASHACISQLYELLSALRQQLEPLATTAPTFAALRQLLADYHWSAVIVALKDLRLRPGAEVKAVRAQQVLHDLRGGALQALAILLQLGELGMLSEADFPRLWFLTRDHLKILRNAITGIDPAGSAHDEAVRLHHINLVIEKWQQATHAVPEARATVHVDSAFHGHIAERCLEFSALDRVLYNLLNNAVRHAADGQVALALLPVSAAQPAQLRIGVANRITQEQRERLHALTGGELHALFSGGLTTGGSGEGLRICADFILRAYGLPSLADALQQGYLGVAQPDDRFIVWVHWPIAGD